MAAITVIEAHIGSRELTKIHTMRTITASYWLPVQVQHPRDKLGLYEGYDSKDYEPVEELMSEVITDMTGIYGNIAGMHYVVEDVREDSDHTCTFQLEIVITAVVAGDADAQQNIYDAFPTDLTEWINIRAEQIKNPKIQGFDLNHIRQGPSMTTHNGSW